MLQASEGALRQAGLHRSASDFEMLLRTFLAVRRREGLGEADGLTPRRQRPTELPRRQKAGSSRRQPRRVPGLR